MITIFCCAHSENMVDLIVDVTFDKRIKYACVIIFIIM